MILLLGTGGPVCAQTPADAARQLASAILASIPARAAVALNFENRSTLDQASVDEFGRNLTARLNDAGCESSAGGLAVRVTISESVRGLLAIARAGDKTVLTSWQAAPARMATGASLSVQSLWSQPEPMLDVMIGPSDLLVLGLSQLTHYRKSGGEWKPVQAAPLQLNRPLPRDARGRLTGTLEEFHIAVAGTSCKGSAQPSLALDCAESGPNAWVAGRNYMQAPGKGEYFSAAELSDGSVITAGIDGKIRAARGLKTTVIAGEAAGSDLVAVQDACGVDWLATSSADDTDSLTGMTAGGRPVTRTISVSGPVTALWPDGAGAIAIVHNQATRFYDAIRISINCQN